MTMYATLEEAIDAAREEFLADNPGIEGRCDVQQLNIKKIRPTGRRYYGGGQILC